MSRPHPASPEVEAARAAFAEAARTIEGMVRGFRAHVRRLKRVADSDPVASWACSAIQDFVLDPSSADSLVLIQRCLRRESRPGEWERGARRFAREDKEAARKEVAVRVKVAALAAEIRAAEGRGERCRPELREELRRLTGGERPWWMRDDNSAEAEAMAADHYGRTPAELRSLRGDRELPMA